MLLLTRHEDEQVIIDGKIVVTVVRLAGGRVQLGFTAERGVTIDRMEVHEAKQAESRRARAKRENRTA